MGIASLILLLLKLTTAIALSTSCPPHHAEINNRCYFISDVTVSSWQQAMKQCEAMDSQLLSIETEQEQLLIHAYLIQNGGNTLYWTSGSDEGHYGQWKWKSTGEDFSYTLWAPGQPDNAGGVEHCVHLVHESSVTVWNDSPCDQRWTLHNLPHYYICEKPKNKPVTDFSKNCETQVSNSCSGIELLQTCKALSHLQSFGQCPLNFVQLAGRCYHFWSKGGVNWQTAYENCEKLNSTLLSIETQAEAMAIDYYLLQQNEIMNYWTSGSDAEVEEKWEWTAIEKPITYRQWCKGAPDNFNGNEDYLHLFHKQGVTCWNDVPDSATVVWKIPLGYICETSLS